MKILHIIASADPVGGGPIEGILRQADATQGAVERHLVTLDLPSSPFLATFPLKVFAIGQPKRKGIFAPLDHYGYSAKYIPWLKKNASNYDAIIVEGLWNFATFGAAFVLPQLKVPYFVFTHGMLDPWFRATYPLKHLGKQVFWLFSEGRLLSSAKSVLFTTEDERDLARGQFVGWRYKETIVGYGTAPPPAFTEDQAKAFHGAVPSLRNRPFILFLSRIHRKKGCDLLVEALSLVSFADPDTQLIIAGPDEEGLTAQLKARAHDLGLADRIHWPGMLQGDAKWGAFHLATAFILPSHQENFGVVVAEALGCGTPALITNRVNIWKTVQNGGAGLVSEDNVSGITDLLFQWNSLPQDQRTLMSNNAYAVFDQFFDVGNVAPALVDKIKVLS